MSKILVIEDEEVLRESITEQLEYEGYEVKSAINGQEGIDIAKAFLPDLIVCDINMPVMDGYAVLDQIRSYSHTQLIPFIFLTAYIQEDYRRRGMRDGADDFLVKPYIKKELLDAVKARLKRNEVYFHKIEETKQLLSHMVTHELRTPLIGMTLSTELLSAQLDNLSYAEIREIIDLQQHGNNRMQHVVDQIIWKTAIDNGVITTSKIMEILSNDYFSFHLTAAIDRARKFARRNQKLPITVTEKASDVLVKAHSEALRHAIGEIIINALHFSRPQGEVVIQQSADHEYVYLKVIDTGYGMNPDDIPTAFNAFVQLNRSKQEQQGLGLGLWLAKNIIELHRGKIKLKSQPGQGAIVAIKLPRL